MTANPIDLVGGLATAANVTKADLTAWVKARVPQLLANASEVRNTTLAGQLMVTLKSTGGGEYVLDTTDTTTADDGISCIISLDGFRFKTLSGVGLNPSSLENYTIVASVASNALTIALKTRSGIDPTVAGPCTFSFGSATAASGIYTPLAIIAATSLVISSGSTMGAANATPFALWLVMFSDGQLSAINCRSATQIFPLNEDGLYSSTAEGGAGAADSAGVFYTTSAVVAKPFRILAKLEWASGLTTAGTWNASPSKIRLKTPGMKLPCDTVQSATISLNEASTLSSTTHTNTTIDGIASTARLQKGMTVTGTNVAANTVIVSVDSISSITVNPPTTGSATNSLTYSWQTTAGTTFTDTALSIPNVALTSPTNSWSYAYSAGTVAAVGIEASTALRSGGVQISPTFVGAFTSAGSVDVVQSGGQGAYFPGSVGPFTFTVALKASSGTATANDNNGGGYLTVAEIMC